MSLSLKGVKEIVAATHNPGKAKEIKALLGNRFEVLSAGALGLPEPEETEVSFVGNALLKARAAAMASQKIALADDSGLSITALGGDPGVMSARWAGPNKDFARVMEVIEIKMQQAKQAQAEAYSPHAYFTCALAVAWPEGHGVVFEGRTDGQIVFPRRGQNGFGYDPIFQPEGFEQSFAEMSPEQKDALSHRAKAFAQLGAALFD